MTTKIRPARGGKGWEYDILFRWPEGGRFRERANAPVKSKSAAERWAQAREASLLKAGKDATLAPKTPVEAVPTLAAFWPRVVSDHYEANRRKPSTIDAAGTIFRVHLEPRLGGKPLDAITTSAVAALKGSLTEREPKTVNNVLSVLSRALKCALEWGVISSLPCRITFARTTEGERPWYRLEEYRRLVAATWSPPSRVLVLLAGSAGLRRGEIRELRWSSVDLERRQIRVQRAVWRNIVDAPKGNRGRDVPMTEELAEALASMTRGKPTDRVLPLSNRAVRNWLARAERRAGLIEGTPREVRDYGGGAIHKLRHTFCSHLAAAGVQALAIKELAGHADLKTTMRYMHLAPDDRGAAMRTLAGYYGRGR